jgi:hypothetical protein
MKVRSYLPWTHLATDARQSITTRTLWAGCWAVIVAILPTCLDCFVCHELLPEAVRIVDRFDANIGPAAELISVQSAEQ